jgi:AcrR family transcriptional regulator
MTRSTRRSGARRTDKLRAILVGTEQLMLEEGYGSVSFRSVAVKAGVAAGLVQYYLPSLDELFIEVLRRSTDRLVGQLEEATRSSAPLRVVWEYASNRTGSTLLMESWHWPIIEAPSAP